MQRRHQISKKCIRLLPFLNLYSFIFCAFGKPIFLLEKASFRIFRQEKKKTENCPDKYFLFPRPQTSTLKMFLNLYEIHISPRCLVFISMIRVDWKGHYTEKRKGQKIATKVQKRKEKSQSRRIIRAWRRNDPPTRIPS